MEQVLNDRTSSWDEDQDVVSAENSNRQAAAARACYLQDVQWIEDRRRRENSSEDMSLPGAAES
jgi:hypothetical protein